VSQLTSVDIPTTVIGMWRIGAELRTKKNLERYVAIAADYDSACFDVAPSYGDGATQVLLGDVLGTQKRTRFQVLGKVGFERGTSILSDTRRMRSSVELSLMELRCSYFDLLQLQRFSLLSERSRIEDLFGMLQDFVNDGIALQVGVCNAFYSSIGYANGLADKSFGVQLKSNQLPLNILNKKHLDNIEGCYEAGIAVMAYNCLASGRLTQTHSKELLQTQVGEAPENDFRYIASLCFDEGVSLTALALQWVKRRRGVASLIIGSSSCLQLKENLEALEDENARKLLSEMEES
jgi:aryl-alcohol dehydrogenase-like predicted oxidoreductase